jgi:hypothetical protein
MTAITIAYDKDGKGTLVHGPEVKPKEQMKYMQEARVKFPALKGAVLLEMWSRADGKRKVAVKPKATKAPKK